MSENSKQQMIITMLAEGNPVWFVAAMVNMRSHDVYLIGKAVLTPTSSSCAAPSGPATRSARSPPDGSQARSPGSLIEMEISVVDYHTAGEPFRIVTSGLPPIEGETVPDRRSYAMTNTSVDRYRQLLVNEPRGHADMYGGFVVPGDDDGADLRVVLAQGRLLHRMRARHDRPRDLGRRDGSGRRRSGRRHRRGDRRTVGASRCPSHLYCGVGATCCLSQRSGARGVA